MKNLTKIRIVYIIQWSLLPGEVKCRWLKNGKKICDVVKEIPLDKLLVETDCPYMAPSPNRGKRNKSDYIRYIIEKIAEIKEISSKEVNLVVNGNFHNLIHNKK